MALLLERDYHAGSKLAELGVPPHPGGDAEAINLGIINLMPKAHEFELELLKALHRIGSIIRPHWIRLESHQYKSSDPAIIAGYRTFDEVMQDQPLDGLILTGAPIEKLPFEAVLYWPELSRILDTARREIPSTLGICWGAAALAERLGIPKEVYNYKRFGVFTNQNLNKQHPLMNGIPNHFQCPYSSHAGIADHLLETAQERGIIQLLAHSKEAGYLLFAGQDQRFVMHLGHPEYSPHRLPEEYQRDLVRGLTHMQPPRNVDIKAPAFEWRWDSDRFFENWMTVIKSQKLNSAAVPVSQV